MKSNELCRLLTVSLEHAVLTTDDGRKVEVVDLHLSVLRNGQAEDWPALSLEGDEMYKLALALERAATRLGSKAGGRSH